MDINEIDSLITIEETMILGLSKKLQEAKNNLLTLKLEKSYLELKEKYPIGIIVKVQHSHDLYVHFKICGYEKRESDVILKGYVWSSKKGKYLDNEDTIYPEHIKGRKKYR